jgi:hypothetical protein
MPNPVLVRNIGHLRLGQPIPLFDRSDLKYDITRGEFATFVYGALDVD